MFLSDDRSETERTTYTARSALLVRGDDGPVLLMFDGIAQTLTRADDPRLSITRFADLTYDLGGMIDLGATGLVSIDTLSTWELVTLTEAERETRLGVPLQTVLEAVHSRLAQPFLSAAAALVGFSTLLPAGPLSM